MPEARVTSRVRRWLRHPALWVVALIAFAVLRVSPAVALLFGVAAGLTLGAPESLPTGTVSKRLLQTSVVLLGFGTRIGEVVRVGASSVLMTIGTISVTLLLAYLLGRMLRIEGKTATLLGTGTAICGGSAIAAMAPAIGAPSDATAIALAVVFILNGVALFVFPPIGHLLAMTQQQFGLWSALAIHDTSSVVGAASVYGAQALHLATVVKLTRALWIAPVALVGSRLARTGRSGAKMQWFLVGFIAAAVIAWLIPAPELFAQLADVGRALMAPTLFMVGAGLTIEGLRRAGVRSLVMGVTLWVVVSIATAALIVSGVLRLG